MTLKIKMTDLEAKAMQGKYCFAIDRGGTFTDILCICPNGRIRTMKLLSEDPLRYDDAPREGIKRILLEENENPITENGLVDTSLIGWVRMGTTVATNALLERKGDPVVLVVNKGFKDLLYIGNQARPKIFNLNIKKPSNLYQKVIEVDCRIVPTSNLCQLEHTWKILQGVSGAKYLEKSTVNENEVEQQLKLIISEGITSIAIVLAHSYACPDHEIKIGEIAKKLGFLHITMSHQAMPMCRIVPRGYTACAEAYLTPHVERYLSSFKSGFKDELKGIDVLFMQSDGGLTQMENFRGARAILSGPAGGVVGYAITGSRDTELPLIGFDMGGTSTDVSRFAGKYEHVLESTTAGITIQAPQLDINTVAAGGGSRLFFRSGLFIVGPESAGANPGPTCYKKGGPLTVTDANLILGRLLPQYFPKIFGPNENESLDYKSAKYNFDILTNDINEYLRQTNDNKIFTIEEVALGFIKVANEAMCRPIRTLTQSRGLDTSRHVLACFGGAGGQHACSIARELGMSKVLIHKYAGILSAYGIALADVVNETQEPCGLEFNIKNSELIKNRLDKLSYDCEKLLKNQGFNDISLETFLNLRYEGTDCALMCSPKKSKIISSHNDPLMEYGDFYSTFIECYKTEFGFVLKNRKIIIDDIRVRGCGKTLTPIEKPLHEINKNIEPEDFTKIYFENGIFDCPIFLTNKLTPGYQIKGPAMLIDKNSTILVETGCRAEITKYGDIVIYVSSNGKWLIDDKLNAVQLSIFSHRFMSIAEQMGRVLQRTSISTNIKERLDFSCALFGPDGGLVSNAPHIPVHLGAMQETVQYQLKVRGETIKSGDVILSNHPQAGGSHLPDLTVITPVFYQNIKKPVFFVASRGHHADIGGITPGSMPAHSTSLAQEGTSFKSFLIVEGGVFREKEVIERFTTPTDAIGATGTRNLADNLSDLKAQIAANQKGIQLVCELIDIYGLKVVQAYMSYIQENAEIAVRDMLKEIAIKTKQRTNSTVLKAVEYMDDGSPINLKINIDEKLGSAVFDFSKSGYEVWGNCNAPRAITLSALIYCLRCMVGHDVPLNQGCLTPIKTIIPKNSILNPSDDAAVVGGNVLTSQRIVDTVLKAFEICAASQGCMNNITIGDENWGYYETVAGGSGAGPTWNGIGGIHSHMTNTRITDPEILELRYPLILNRFCLRDDNSGGRGQFNGGEGIIREILFRKPVTLSVLTERRTLRPYGIANGNPGKCGVNLLIKTDGRIINLGGKTAVNVKTGDIFHMKTPGGGGYGPISNNKMNSIPNEEQQKTFIERGSLFAYKISQESS